MGNVQTAISKNDTIKINKKHHKHIKNRANTKTNTVQK